MPNSTRLAIVRQSLDDILERLGEMPMTPRIRDLRDKATAYDHAVRAWDARPITEQERAAMLKAVIDLNVEVIRERMSQRS